MSLFSERMWVFSGVNWIVPDDVVACEPLFLQFSFSFPHWCLTESKKNLWPNNFYIIHCWTVIPFPVDLRLQSASKTHWRSMCCYTWSCNMFLLLPQKHTLPELVQGKIWRKTVNTWVPWRCFPPIHWMSVWRRRILKMCEDCGIFFMHTNLGTKWLAWAILPPYVVS